MSVVSIRNEIEVVDGQLVKTKSNLRQQRNRIITFAIPFIKERQRKFVEEKIKENAEKTLSIGKDKLGDLKSRLKAIEDRGDKAIEALLSDEEFWVNIDNESLISIDKNVYEQEGEICKNVRPNIMLGIRSAFGPVGKLLTDFGYVKPIIRNSYNRNSGGEWIQINESSVIYGYSMQLPEELGAGVQEYYKGISNLLDLLIKKNELKKELVQQEAADLWNEV